MSRPLAVMAMRPPSLADDLLGHETERLSRLVQVHAEVVTSVEDDSMRDTLAQTEILVAGWGCPPLDGAVLDRMPALRAVFFAGGTAAAILDPVEAARRGIACGDAGEANGKAVAEFTFATIILANKRARVAELLYRERRAFIDREVELRDSGSYGATIGLIGASRIGRRVAELLRSLDVEILIYDPYASVEDIVALGARKCELDDLLIESDVVSIHAPATPETDGMIGSRELALLRDGAVLINTARGSLVDHDALLAPLRTGRIDAVLDVTTPEPLPPDHELWALPNVTLTPHIAGATGNELRRLGSTVVDAVEAFVDGEDPSARTASRLERTP